MTAWKCPACKGGFSSPAKKDDTYACPWCGNKISEHWETIRPFTAVTKKEDSETSGGLLGGLFR